MNKYAQPIVLMAALWLVLTMIVFRSPTNTPSPERGPHNVPYTACDSVLSRITHHEDRALFWTDAYRTTGRDAFEDRAERQQARADSLINDAIRFCN